MVGFLPGGLGHANCVASLIFAGMSGAAVADAAGLGQVELKAMDDAGYDRDFSVAITAASSTIGPIFPPSIPMVILGLVAGVSVGRLFLGGVVPGVLMTVALMVMVYLYAKKRNYPRTPFPTFRQFVTGLPRCLPAAHDPDDPARSDLDRLVHPDRGGGGGGGLRPHPRHHGLPGAAP